MDLKLESNIETHQIRSLYKISHSKLQQTLQRFKQKIMKEFDEFSESLVLGLNNINYLRFRKQNPDDDFDFVFADKEKQNEINEKKAELRKNILDKMINFNLIKLDHFGIADSSIYELEELIASKSNILNFKEYCPSGFSFLNQHKNAIQKFAPFWSKQTQSTDFGTLLQDVSEQFPQEDIKTMGSLFAQMDIKISFAKMIFKASDHNFQSASFKNHCVDKSPTLLIAKSDKGFIFGGYTPCRWLKTKEQEFVSDPESKSFLFSLSKKTVFPIKPNQKNYAISAYGGWGPIFGSPYGPDLSIADKCHINEHSCSSLGTHYQIPSAIKEYSNEAYSLLAGSKNFKVIEYQIYELIVE